MLTPGPSVPGREKKCFFQILWCNQWTEKCADVTNSKAKIQDKQCIWPQTTRRYSTLTSGEHLGRTERIQKSLKSFTEASRTERRVPLGSKLATRNCIPEDNVFRSLPVTTHTSDRNPVGTGWGAGRGLLLQGGGKDEGQQEPGAQTLPGLAPSLISEPLHQLLSIPQLGFRVGAGTKAAQAHNSGPSTHSLHKDWSAGDTTGNTPDARPYPWAAYLLLLLLLPEHSFVRRW